MGHDGEIDRDRPGAIVLGMRHRLQSDTYNRLIIDVELLSRDRSEGRKDPLTLDMRSHTPYDNGSPDISTICAIGLKYMAFYWDPRNADILAQQLRSSVAGEEVHFPAQLTPTPGCSLQISNLGTRNATFDCSGGFHHACTYGEAAESDTADRACSFSSKEKRARATLEELCLLSLEVRGRGVVTTDSSPIFP
jgi:hypothetical protein